MLFLLFSHDVSLIVLVLNKYINICLRIGNKFLGVIERYISTLTATDSESSSSFWCNQLLFEGLKGH